MSNIDYELIAKQLLNAYAEEMKTLLAKLKSKGDIKRVERAALRIVKCTAKRMMGNLTETERFQLDKITESSYNTIAAYRAIVELQAIESTTRAFGTVLGTLIKATGKALI